MTGEEGYSTLMDAVLFLTLVGACAVILGPAIAGRATERSMADRGLRELAADLLCSLEYGQVDYFEYRILGDAADVIAGAGGVNSSTEGLYRDLTRALLGRGSRHMTAVDIAAGAAACQFSVRWGDAAMRMNPITPEYDSAATALIDRSVRARLDARYRYEFTLRWTPLAGVPLNGEVRAGDRSPPGAASASVRVSMPYETNVTREFLERLNGPDLGDIGRSVDEYRTTGDRARLLWAIRRAVEGCTRNTTGAVARELWDNTLGSFASGNTRPDPARALKRLSGPGFPDLRALIGLNTSWEGALECLAIASYQGEMQGLAQEIVEGVTDGTMGEGDARRTVLDWLASRYEPSAATVTVSVWT